MSGFDQGALDAIRRSDEKAANDERRPLPSQAELFPRMRSPRAEFYIEQIRGMVYGPSYSDSGLHWWNEQMSVRDRRFLCRVARADRELAGKTWIELSRSDRARMLAAFTGLLEWVNGFHAPLCHYKEFAFDL